MSANPIIEQELCPVCGKWVDELTDKEGWCIWCVARSQGRVVRVCKCGRTYATHPNHGSSQCSKCKYANSPSAKWQRLKCSNCYKKFHGRRRGKNPSVRFCSREECRHAKMRYNHYRRKGLTVRESLDKARIKVKKPKCVNCGEEFDGRNGQFYCTRTKCKNDSSRIYHYMKRLGMTREQAVAHRKQLDGEA